MKEEDKPQSANAIAETSEHGKDISRFFMNNGRMMQPLQHSPIGVARLAQKSTSKHLQWNRTNEAIMSSLDSLIEAMGFTKTPYAHREIVLARHASHALAIFDRSIDAFEEYQRFQTKHFFEGCKYLISFIGLPGQNRRATFAGLYRIVGVFRRGEAGFREPEGDDEVVERCQGQQYLYAMERLTEFDQLRKEWDIIWDTPQPAKYRHFRGHHAIAVEKVPDTPGISTEEYFSKLGLYSASEATVDDDAESFSEGTAFYATHLKRERNAKLVHSVKTKAKEAGNYRCQVCLFDFAKVYGIDYLECHHLKQVSLMSPDEVTREEDVVLLCANCHRAVHKRKPWLTRVTLSELLVRNP